MWFASPNWQTAVASDLESSELVRTPNCSSDRFVSIVFSLESGFVHKFVGFHNFFSFTPFDFEEEFSEDLSIKDQKHQSASVKENLQTESRTREREHEARSGTSVKENRANGSTRMRRKIGYAAPN